MTAALEAEGIALRAEALIALRRHALDQTNRTHLANLPGGYSSRHKGAGQEVADLRDYQPGDDIRHLDRNTTARTGRLHIRRFQQERDRVTLLVADFRPAMFWGLSRATLSVAAAEALGILGWAAVEAGGRVGLLAITPEAPVIVRPRGRARGQLDVIGGLVRAHDAALRAVFEGNAKGPPLDASLAAVERICPTGADVILASGFEDLGPDIALVLERIEQRRGLRLLALTDAETLPPGHYPVRLQSGRKVRLQVGAASRAADHVEVGGGPGSSPGLGRARQALVIPASEPPEAVALRLRGHGGGTG